MEQESGGKSVIRHVIKNWMLGRGGKAAMAQSALRHEARWVFTYRVTIPLVQNLPLTSKQKFRFGLARPEAGSRMAVLSI